MIYPEALRNSSQMIWCLYFRRKVDVWRCHIGGIDRIFQQFITQFDWFSHRICTFVTFIVIINHFLVSRSFCLGILNKFAQISVVCNYRLNFSEVMNQKYSIWVSENSIHILTNWFGLLSQKTEFCPFLYSCFVSSMWGWIRFYI